MRADIAIVDYGVGNLRSVEKALEKVGCLAVVTGDPKEIAAAEAVILPGVGAFGAAMQSLAQAGLTEVVREAATDGRPFLGICLGLQLLFEASEESFGAEGGVVRGLGVLPGVVRRFPPGLKVPEIGWNTVEWTREHPLMAGVPNRSFFYFVHSYYAVPAAEADILGVTEYGVRFASSVTRGPLAAHQFHPEKSGEVGLQLLANFAAASRGLARKAGPA